jgi:hypothetical protein
MTAALQMRQYFVMAEEPWITIPFTVSRPTHIQMVMNSALGLPCLLRQVDEVDPQAVAQGAPAAVMGILDRLLGHIGRLAALEEEARKDEAVWEWFEVTSKLDAFTPFTFSSFTVANLFILIWTFRLLALEGLQHLLVKVPVLLHGPMLHEAFAESNRRTNQLATWVLRSIEYLVSKRFRLYGSSSTAMPLQVVASYYAECTVQDQELEFWYSRVRDLIIEQGYDGLRAIFRQDK